MNKEDGLFVGFDYCEKQGAMLMVSRRKPNNAMEIVSIFSHEEAEDLYLKLIREKQIRLPVKFNDLGYNECPTCGFSVETDDRYCRNCGQAIKLEIGEE